ncbi:MAG: hypothetical protein IMW86_06465 [Hydrogenibacillus sp.]|nr:hypothetical protein [Hydrogenibacillus sp.]
MSDFTFRALVLLIVALNAALAWEIAWRGVDRVRVHVESEALPAMVAEPLFHDYDFEYELTGQHRDGPYLIETYREVEVVRDADGRALSRRPTGETIRLRYVAEPEGYELYIDD